jgi:C-terminal processing protease CtpA/Prc
VSFSSQFFLFLFNIFLSFSSPDEVQASPRSSVGGEEDRKSKKSERSEHSEPQEPEPEVEAVVAAVNEVEIEKEEKLASEHLPRNCKVTKWPHLQGYGFILSAKQDRVGQFIDKIHDDCPADAASLKEGDIIIEVNGVNIENETHQQVFQRIKAGGDQTTLLVMDREGDDYYKSKGMTISSELSIVRQCSNPSRGKMSIMHTCFMHTVQSETQRDKSL